MASVTPEVLHRFTGIHIQERLLPFIWTLIRVMIVLLGIVIILQEWGFEISGLIASLGIVGLAFSLAAKDTVENLFGFTAIVGDNPFEVGNFIKTPDVSGTIEQVGVRSTRVRQLDQALVTVPNSKLAGAVVLNWSRLEKRRLGFSLGLTYDTTSDEIRVVTYRIREMLKSRSTIDPESVVVNFTDFGSSSLDILIVSQILLADWKEFTAEKQDILLAIMDIVSDMGLSIAYPSQTLYIDAPGITPAKPQRPAVELPPELLGITEDPDMLLENIEDAEIRELTDGQESDEAGDEQTGEVKR